MHFVSIFLPNALLANVEWDANCDKRFRLEYERSKLVCIPLETEMIRKRYDKTKITESGVNKICSAVQEKFADRGMSRGFTNQPWHLFFEKAKEYTTHLVIDEQDCVACCRKRPVALLGAQGNLTSGTDPKVNSRLNGVDDDDDWGFDDAKRGMSVEYCRA